MLVPVVGPDVTLVNDGSADQTFSTLIGQRIVERWNLSVPPGLTTMDEAVAAFVRGRGQDEIERLYRVITTSSSMSIRSLVMRFATSRRLMTCACS